MSRSRLNISGYNVPSTVGRVIPFTPWAPASPQVGGVLPNTQRTILNLTEARQASIKALKGPGAKFIKGVFKHRIAFSGIAFGATAALTLGKSLMSTLRWTTPADKIQQGAGYGPGYLTWGKRVGMPANHLGTQDMMDSLNRMRHTSIL